MVSIDWTQVIGGLLVGSSALGGIAYAGRAAWKRMKALPPGTTAVAPGRAADELPPAGAVAWAIDISESMGAASAESKLKAILGGATRDDARKLRISELEAKP